MRLKYLGFGCLSLCIACGSRDAGTLDKAVHDQTEIIEEGGNSPFQASLSFRSPEAMAIQDVPYAEGALARKHLFDAVARYRNQWTFSLVIGPKPGSKEDPLNPVALDIENNGGMWRDHARNLHRLMFEMGDFIRLMLPDGQELKPMLVEFQRSFGIGKNRTFLLVFPSISNGKPVRPPFEVRVRDFGQGMGVLAFHFDESPSSVSDQVLVRIWKRQAESMRAPQSP